MNNKILVTTYPFGVYKNYKVENDTLEDLYSISDNVKLNEYKRKLKKDELIKELKEFQPDIIIAGTEKYDNEILDLVPNLKMISRVGIGLDSVDLEECKKRGIVVTYTPDAPSNSVAELTICQMLNMLRNVSNVSNNLKNNHWNRYIGKEISSCIIGIIGFGRIGKRVFNKLYGFNVNDVFINDVDDNVLYGMEVFSRSKEFIYKNCDIITIHIPLSEDSYNLITKKELNIMKKDACLINMSRGGIIKEDDLYNHLIKNKDFYASIDVFENEPYDGLLCKLNNAYLTPHLGSCSVESRYKMEHGAVIEIKSYLENSNFKNRVI